MARAQQVIARFASGEELPPHPPLRGKSPQALRSAKVGALPKAIAKSAPNSHEELAAEEQKGVARLEEKAGQQ